MDEGEIIKNAELRIWDGGRDWIAEPVARSPQTTRQSARNDERRENREKKR